MMRLPLSLWRQKATWVICSWLLMSSFKVQGASGDGAANQGQGGKATEIQGKVRERAEKRPMKNRRIRASCWKISLLPRALRAAGNSHDIFSCTFYMVENPGSCFVYEATECSYSKMSFQTSGIWWKGNNLFISFQASVFSALQIFFFFVNG